MATVADHARTPLAAEPALRGDPRSAAQPQPAAARGTGETRRTRLAGNVSIDMDTLADYARGYGFAYQRRPDPVYETGLTRFLDLLQNAGVKATIFAVGRDAELPEHRAVLQRAVAEGHEVANHTYTHPRRLSTLRGDALEYEIGTAHDLLSELRGSPVRGFRAPCYDVSRAVLAALTRRGYLYDSSIHPTLLGPVIDLAVLLKSRFRKLEARPSTYLHALAPLRPYHPGRWPWLPTGRGPLLEIPLSAAPLCRLPFYGTFIQATGMKMFHRLLNWCRWWGRPLSFHFHAVELVSLADAGVEPEFGVHPGLSRPAADKQRDATEMLAAFGEKYELLTLEQQALRRLAASGPDAGPATH